jgi:hypothetical protein
MLHDLIQVLGSFILATKLNGAIEPQTPQLTATTRFTYAFYIAEASRRAELDPYLVAAVMWHESRFLNMPRNETDDYGLMQVHWQKAPSPWLKGLSRADLMDPWTNISVGAQEMAYMRRFCFARDGKDPGHEWWGHYKYGVVVLGRKYGQTVLWRYRVLRQAPAS